MNRTYVTEWKKNGLRGAFAVPLALVLAGCCLCPLCGPKTDAEGFVYMDGRRIAAEAPSEYYIIRYECPGKPAADKHPFRQKWDFVEVRQLKDGVTIVSDGVFSTTSMRRPGKNWRRWLRCGARNVRVKFVGADYDVAADGKSEAPAGFTALFNGKDLTGWRGMTREKRFDRPDVRRAMWPEEREELQAKANELAKQHWHVRDGVLFFDGLPGGYNLAAAKDYGNVEVIADWRLLRVHGDSGFYFRGMNQVQIWDPNLWNGMGSGCIWNNTKDLFSASVCADNPIGDWNRCRMRLVGDKIDVWLNGVKVVDGVTYENEYDPEHPAPLIDRFELQCHGDPIEFRNIFVKELPEDPADVPDPARAVRGEKVDLLAQGIAGWEAVDPKARMGWSVKDGVLSNYTGIDPRKTSNGGAGTTNLKTKRTDFFDFDLSYDVLVPPKCNSGVYLRGRYEIQVVDSYGEPVDRHNMAALYEHITPRVAAEKPAGQWQHVDVTFYKRHITVTLNGVRIIDNAPVPGVTPAALDGNEFVPGPILLQGDHSNASFKNMILTKIVK